MIGNRYLKFLFEHQDIDTSLNQLLEQLKSRDKDFIDSLYEAIDIDICNDKEIKFLTITSALIDYYLQINDCKVPDWLRDKRLSFNRPYYHSRRISDFDKVKLLYTSPAPFRARNVCFDLEGIKRV